MNLYVVTRMAGFQTLYQSENHPTSLCCGFCTVAARLSTLVIPCQAGFWMPRVVQFFFWEFQQKYEDFLWISTEL